MPRPIDLQMLFHVVDQMPDPLAGMVAGALVMDIAEGPFNRIRLRTVGGQVEQFEAGMGGEPRHHGGGLVNLGIVHYHLEVAGGARGIGAVQGLEQVQEEPVGLRYHTQWAMVPVVILSAPAK